MWPTARPVLWVLGASGFVGVHAVEAGLAAGFDVVGIARAEASAALSPAARRACRWVRADLAAERSVVDLFASETPAAVLGLAAVARAEEVQRNPARAARLNVALPAELGALAHDAGVRVVWASTDQVFGALPPPDGGFHEDVPPAPVGVYGSTKAAGESALLCVDPAALVARLPLLFGDSRGRGLGASDSLRAAIGRGDRPFLFEDEWRTPLDVQDAARLLVELVAGAATGIVHLPGPQRLSRAELGELIVGAPPWPFDRGPRSARGAESRPADTSLATHRLRALVTHEPLHPAHALARAR